MSKLPNYELKQQAFELYERGMILADIAKKLNVSANTVTTWKITGKWDELCPNRIVDKQHSKDLVATNNNSTELVEQIKDKLLNALKNDDIAPKKWKDIIDTLDFLSRELKPAKKKETEILVSDLDDKDLDSEIESLQKLVNKPEDEAIIIDKEDVIEVDGS